MTAQLLTSELNNLIQESKRKHNDLRQVGYLVGLSRLFWAPPISPRALSIFQIRRMNES